MSYLDSGSFHIFDDAMWDLKNNPKNPDFFGIVVGGTGKGKSNLAQAIAYDTDLTFSIKQIIFNRLEWDILKSEMHRGQAAIFDEGIDWFFSRNGMSSIGKESVQEMVKIRSMGFFIMVCIPTLRLLDWYIKSERPHFIIRANSPKFELWSFIENEEQTEDEAYEKLQTLVKFGFDSVRPDFRGTWNPVDGIRWKRYEDKKRRFQIGVRKSPKIIEAQIKAEKKRENSWTIKDISEEKKISIFTVHKYINLLLPKKYFFYDITGKKRITMEGKQILDRKWIKHIERRIKSIKGRKRIILT